MSIVLENGPADLPPVRWFSEGVLVGMIDRCAIEQLGLAAIGLI